jgi:hypothetical protein
MTHFTALAVQFLRLKTGIFHFDVSFATKSNNGEEFLKLIPLHDKHSANKLG